MKGPAWGMAAELFQMAFWSVIASLQFIHLLIHGVFFTQTVLEFWTSTMT